LTLIQAELKAQREDILRQKDALQRQVEVFEEHKQRNMKTYTPPHSHWSPGDDPSRPVSAGHGRQLGVCSDASQRSLIESLAVHQRSASDDLLQNHKWSVGDNPVSGDLLNCLVTRSTIGRADIVHRSSPPPIVKSVSRNHSMSTTAAGRGTISMRRGEGNSPLSFPLSLPKFTNSSAGVVDRSSPEARGDRHVHRLGEISNDPGSEASNLSHQYAVGFSLPSEHLDYNIRSSSSAVPTCSPSGGVVASSRPDVSPLSIFDRRLATATSTTLKQTDSFSPTSPSSTGISCKEYLRNKFFGTDDNNQTNKPRLLSTMSSGNILQMKFAERPRPRSATAATVTYVPGLGTHSAHQSPVTVKRSTGQSGLTSPSVAGAGQLARALITYQDGSEASTGYYRSNSSPVHQEKKVVYH